MAYNLIEERWIPVRRQSGKVESIAPWQIAEREDPPILIESSRPDFDAALLEMLIGLVQTVMAPEDEIGWKEVYRAEPDPDELRKRMLTVRDAFSLDGDGPRFFQDIDVHKHPKADRKPIGTLLIDRGTASDTELFAKTGGFEQFGLPMAAAALLTIQQFAPSGGAGIRTSMRGGGPLSTTIKDVTLWKTCWCNVISDEDFLDMIPGERKKRDPKDTFPWLAKTRTSEKDAASTVPEHIHPLQHFWSLPRRFRLCMAKAQSGRCAITGEDGPVVTEAWSRPHGTSYNGPFRHPLTAYTVTKPQEPPNPKKGGSGFSYRDWPLLHMRSDVWIPSAVVEVFYRRERWRTAKVSNVVARGYAMDNMKPLRFIEGDTLLLHVAAQVLRDMRGDVAQLVETSDKVRKDLSRQVKAAWSDRPSDLPGDVQARTDVAFMAASEPSFYETLRGIAAARESNQNLEAPKTDYIKALQREAFKVFDALCPIDADLGADELGRIVRARKGLAYFTRHDELAVSVGLEEPKPKGNKPKTGTSDSKSSKKSKGKETTK